MAESRRTWHMEETWSHQVEDSATLILIMEHFRVCEGLQETRGAFNTSIFHFDSTGLKIQLLPRHNILELAISKDFTIRVTIWLYRDTLHIAIYCDIPNSSLKIKKTELNYKLLWTLCFNTSNHVILIIRKVKRCYQHCVTKQTDAITI